MTREAATAPAAPYGATLFQRTDYRLAETDEDKDGVYRLRHRAYVHAGLMDPVAGGRVVDPYDDAPNAWTFGVHVDGDLCGSVRLHLLASACRTSFATQLFGDVLHPRLDRGEVFVDAARLAVDPEAAHRHPELPLLIVRLAYLACAHFEADTGLAQVRSDHQAFYRRIFRHRPITEPRAFPGVTRAVSLLAADFRSDREKVMERYPIMRSSTFERRMLFGPAQARSPTAVPAEAAE